MLWTDFRDSNGFLDVWREFDHLSRALSGLAHRRNYDFPPVNVWIDTDAAIVTSEVPGLDVDDIDISIIGKNLTIRGARKEEQLQEDENYHRRERWNGQFSRTIELPFNVQADKVEAKFSRGVLQINLPRAEEEKPRKIDIKGE